MNEGQCSCVGFIIIPEIYDGGAEPICDICNTQYVWNDDNLLIHPQRGIRSRTTSLNPDMMEGAS